MNRQDLFSAAVLASGMLLLAAGLLMASGKMHVRWLGRRGDRRPLVWLVSLFCGSLLLAFAILGITNTLNSTLLSAVTQMSRLELLLSERMPISALSEARHRELVDSIRDSKPISPGPPPVGAVQDFSRLADALENRLPTNELIERRHRELVDALRAGLTSRVAVDPTERRRFGAVAGYVMLIAGFVGAIIACASAWRASSASATDCRAALRVGTLLGASTLFSVGGLTLVKDLTLDVTFQPERVGPSPVDRPITTLQHGFVGPFVSGQGALLEPNAAKTVKQVIESLVAASPSRDLQALYIVGSADTMPPTQRLARDYNSNVGLARARADWVLAQIHSSRAVPLDPTKAVTSAVGPAHIGAGVSVQDLASDRRVQVYGLWSTKPIEQSPTP